MPASVNTIHNHTHFLRVRSKTKEQLFQEPFRFRGVCGVIMKASVWSGLFFPPLCPTFSCSSLSSSVRKNKWQTFVQSCFHKAAIVARSQDQNCNVRLFVYQQANRSPAAAGLRPPESLRAGPPRGSNLWVVLGWSGTVSSANMGNYVVIFIRSRLQYGFV